MIREVVCGGVCFGGGKRLVLIAGPCVIEGEDQAVGIALRLKRLAHEFSMPWVFKASYDKANRTSLGSFRGPGLEAGLKILQRVREEVGVPVLADVHRFEEIEAAASVLDILQIPALLCRQTDFVQAVAATGKAVNVKKGQFLAPWDVCHIVEKVEATGNRNVLITERGTSFGYNNLVADMRSLVVLRQLGYPVVFDATHSVQLPGGQGGRSGGQREFVPALSRAAVAAGCDALFLEVHENPDQALSDGPNAVALEALPSLLAGIRAVEQAVQGRE